MSRSKKYKSRKVKNSGKSRKNGGVFTPKFIDNQHVRIGGRYHGILEINPKAFGFIRRLDYEFTYEPKDPFLVPDMVKHYELRPGLVLEGEFEQDQQGNRRVVSIDRINGAPVENWQKVNRFELQTPIMPTEHIRLGHSPDDIELRVIDLIAPIGRGQRALIVAPPRTGKTVLLKKIAKSLTDNYPDIHTAILLVDERQADPEPHPCLGAGTRVCEENGGVRQSRRTSYRFAYPPRKSLQRGSDQQRADALRRSRHPRSGNSQEDLRISPEY